ncbi:MAG: aldehyde dehydrogenase, partial [Planctomycetota bacterium]
MTDHSAVPHFPVLRAGKEYESLDRVELKSHRDGETVASVSQANAGIIRRDMKKLEANARTLRAMPIAERIDRCREAARIFLNEELPIGGDHMQSPDDFVDQLSSTSGLPHVMVRANMEKNAFVLSEM